MDGKAYFSTLGLKNPTTIQIQSNSITLTQSYHLINTSTGTEEDINTISLQRQATGYDPIIILFASTGKTITLKHNTGNFFNPSGSDVEITSNQPALIIYNNVTNKFYPLGSGGGGGSATFRGVVAQVDALTQSIDRSAADPAELILQFDNQIVDSDNFFTPTGSEFTIPTGLAGKYLIIYTLEADNFGNTGSYPVSAQLYLNGAYPSDYFWNYSVFMAQDEQYIVLPFITVMDLAEGDIIEAVAASYDAAAGNIDFYAMLSMTYLGA